MPVIFEQVKLRLKTEIIIFVFVVIYMLNTNTAGVAKYCLSTTIQRSRQCLAEEVGLCLVTMATDSLCLSQERKDNAVFLLNVPWGLIANGMILF